MLLRITLINIFKLVTLLCSTVLFVTDLLLNSSGLSIMLVTDKIHVGYVNSVIKLMTGSQVIYTYTRAHTHT